MTKQDLNAILAGLRLLQLAMEQGPLPPDLDGILNDDGQDPPIDADGIDVLCEELNFGADYNKELFEVSRVHNGEKDGANWDEITMEVCHASDCPESHMFSVYVRNPEHDGRSEWLSDHVTESLAVTAAASYEIEFDQIIAAQR